MARAPSKFSVSNHVSERDLLLCGKVSLFYVTTSTINSDQQKQHLKGSSPGHQIPWTISVALEVGLLIPDDVLAKVWLARDHLSET